MAPSPPPPGAGSGRRDGSEPSPRLPAPPPRTTRTGAAPRTTTTRRPSRRRPVLAAAALAGLLAGIGLIVLVLRPPPPAPPPPITNWAAECAKAEAAFKAGRFVEADGILHGILDQARAFTSEDDRSREILREIRIRHDAEYHPMARMEEDSGRDIDPWAREADALPNPTAPSPDRVNRLITQGESIRDRYPLAPRRPEVMDRLKRLESLRPAAGPSDLEKFQQLMLDLRPEIESKRFGPVVTGLLAFRGTIRAPDIITKVDAQIEHHSDQARHHLDKWTVEAERLRANGDPAGGQKVLEEALLKLKGSRVERDAERRLQDFQAGRPSGA